jgi:chitinase
VQEFLTTNGGTYLLFAYRENEAVGVFAGALVKDAILNSTIIQEYINRVNSNGISQSLLIQVCRSDLEADFTFGIVAAAGDTKLEVVQSAVGNWAKGTCVTGADGTASLGNITLPVAPPTKVSFRSPTRVRPRALGQTTTVASGDSCWSLSQKCSITLNQFEQYNPGSSFCSSLQPGQLVCCSSGSLPTPTPKPNGSCASYVVKSGDWCAKIAAANAVSVANLETWNQNTWGWTGCNNLQAGINMCLSTGTPPMPAPMANALCGPEVPGNFSSCFRSQTRQPQPVSSQRMLRYLGTVRDDVRLLHSFGNGAARDGCAGH